MSTGPQVRLLADGQRLHLQHGPIDLVIGVEGDRSAAFAAATRRFATILEELVAELALLRRAVGEPPQGMVARRMVAATRPFGAAGFVTPMAAVAGAVAEAVLAAMLAEAKLRRAYVNNGGDIALHLSAGMSYRLAIADPRNRGLGIAAIGAEDGIGGVATSGLGGRSLSFGIADAVTVLAATAPEADAAATMIANQVNLPGHGAIHRTPANHLYPDSDLGYRLVVTGVDALTAAETATALDNGLRAAERFGQSGLLIAAALFLNGQSRRLGRSFIRPLSDHGTLADA